VGEPSLAISGLLKARGKEEKKQKKKGREGRRAGPFESKEKEKKTRVRDERKWTF